MTEPHAYDWGLSQPGPRKSVRTTFDDASLAEIQTDAATKEFMTFGAEGAKRKAAALSTICFVLGASMSRYARSKAYRRNGSTDVILGNRFTTQEPDSSRNNFRYHRRNDALGRCFRQTPRKRWDAERPWRHLDDTGGRRHDPGRTGHSQTLIYQISALAYGDETPTICAGPTPLNNRGRFQGSAKAGVAAACCWAEKISDRVAEMRSLPKGIDQRSACRQSRLVRRRRSGRSRSTSFANLTNWEKLRSISRLASQTAPISTFALCVKAGADVIVLDGMQGGRRRVRMCSSNMSAFQFWRRSARPCRRCRIWECTEKFSSSCPAASAAEPTSRQGFGAWRRCCRDRHSRARRHWRQ